MATDQLNLRIDAQVKADYFAWCLTNHIKPGTALTQLLRYLIYQEPFHPFLPLGSNSGTPAQQVSKGETLATASNASTSSPPLASTSNTPTSTPVLAADSDGSNASNVLADNSTDPMSSGVSANDSDALANDSDGPIAGVSVGLANDSKEPNDSDSSALADDSNVPSPGAEVLLGQLRQAKAEAARFRFFLTRQQLKKTVLLQENAELKRQMEAKNEEIKNLKATAASLAEKLREAEEGKLTRDAEITSLKGDKRNAAKLVLDDMLDAIATWEPKKEDGTPVAPSTVQPRKSNASSFLDWYLADKLKPITPDNAEAEPQQLNLLD